MCVFVPDLYKEYRSLKQAKENSRSDATCGQAEQPRSTPEVKVLRESVSVNVETNTICLTLLSACC